MAENQTRPPIVSILGHVDHGKTTLLDKIRNTNITAREAGGITQSIGAWSVTTSTGDTITFIDTPGHQAFHGMRLRGADVADIVILVVASDDGVMPQTKESIKFIKETKTPFIVAMTKSDAPGANPEKVKTQLLENEVFVEGYGGDTPIVQVSAKTGAGIDDLLEMISLVAGVNEIKGDKEGTLEAYIIESEMDARRGVVVSAVVKAGTLKTGTEIEAEGVLGRVRGLFDQNQKLQKEVLPGFPVQILGFSEVPEVGAIVTEKGKTTEMKVKKRIIPKSEGFPIILKVDTSGSLEAILGQLADEVGVMHSGVGEITENDVETADTTKSIIVGFEVKVPKDVARRADEIGVKIYTYRIIYELLADVEKWRKEKEEEGREKILGRAKILASFEHDDKSKIAGCRQEEGRLTKSDRIRIVRESQILGNVKLKALKKQKQDIDKVTQGEEFGILFEPQFDFQVGDVLESWQP